MVRWFFLSNRFEQGNHGGTRVRWQGLDLIRLIEGCAFNMRASLIAEVQPCQGLSMVCAEKERASNGIMNLSVQ